MKHVSNMMNNVGYKPLHFHCETYLVHIMRIYIFEIKSENQVKYNKTHTYQKNLSSDSKACLRIM